MLITRTSALAAAVVVGLLGPGLAPALALDTTPAAGDDAWKPPPVSGVQPPPVVPADKGLLAGPGTSWEAQQACISSSGSQAIKQVPNGQTWLRLDQARQYATGKGQIVAVIDTGVNQHIAFTGRLLGELDYLNKIPNVSQDDCDGHGTEVAGIIGADTKGMDVGFEGVAPDAKILPIRQSSSVIMVKTTDPQGGQSEKPAGNAATLAYAIMNAVDKGATVINMSLSSCLTQNMNGLDQNSQRMLQSAIHYAVNDRRVVLVAAAGNLQPSGNCGTQNDNPDPNRPKWIESPAWFSDDVLSVAAIATDSNGQTAGAPANFTMWGPWVSVAGPGTGNISLDPGTRTGLVNQETANGKSQPLQGTSFAAPYVAGLAALVREKYPQLDAHQVMHRIEMTAQHPGTPSGRNNQVGYGMIDPVAALTAVIPGEPNSPKPAAGRQIPSDVGVADVKSLSPMMYAMYGTLIGVALLLITLFVVHAASRSRRNHKPAPQRLRM